MWEVVGAGVPGDVDLGAVTVARLERPRDVVVVDVRLEDRPDVDAALLRGGEEPPRVALRIDEGRLVT